MTFVQFSRGGQCQRILVPLFFHTIFQISCHNYLRLVSLSLSSRIVPQFPVEPHFFFSFSRHPDQGKRLYDSDDEVQWYVHVQWVEQSKVMDGKIALE